MDETICALLYKKYSLNTLKLQILSQLLLILLVCFLSLTRFKINDNYILLSINQILVIASYLFMIGGLVNSSTEIENPESVIVYFLSGNKNETAQKIILVELIDCVLQAILTFLVILSFFSIKGISGNFNTTIFISYLSSTVLCFLIAYYLTLFFKSSMVALAILLLFPILVLPYLERVFPEILPYIYYKTISESFKSPVISDNQLILLFWDFVLILLIYLKVKKRLKNG